MMMRSSFVLVCSLWLLPVGAGAVSFVAQPDVFTPDQWGAPTADETYYGELTGWPHTFTFVVPGETQVSYQLSTLPDATPVSLLLVRAAERGVSEVTRQTGLEAVWSEVRDERFALNLVSAEPVTTTIPAGLYRLEVSNPENIGKYQLTVGEGSQGGFFTTLRQGLQVHSFYGWWTGALLMWQWSTLIGSLLVLIGWVLWRRKKHA
jgi:hypothetical protein